MFRLNRMTEYALIALKSLSEPAQLVGEGARKALSAREIAEKHGLPFEITAKTLQKLRDQGWIESAHGVRGGYALSRPLATVSFAEFIDGMEGDPLLTECCGGVCACEYQARCGIKPFMISVNDKIRTLLESVKLSEVLAETVEVQS